MGSKTLNGRTKQKYDTEANWTSKNPVLLQGEIAFSVTSSGLRMKVGDGTSRFTALDYIDFGFVATEEDM